MRKTKIIIAFFLTLTIIGCSDSMESKPSIDMKKLQENLLIANKKALGVESDQIEKYIQNKEMDATKTPTGLRYSIYQKSNSEETVTEGQTVIVKYTVSLLDGTECYTTKDKEEEFTVGKDYVESGLHEGVTYMDVGDKAILIIPSHLAHGLAGDLKKIPFRSTIVYDIKLVAVKK